MTARDRGQSVGSDSEDDSDDLDQEIKFLLEGVPEEFFLEYVKS